MPILDEERKLTLDTSFGVLKGFMKTLKTSIKHYETPQRSVKIKIWVFILIQLFNRSRPNLGRREKN